MSILTSPRRAPLEPSGIAQQAEANFSSLNAVTVTAVLMGGARRTRLQHLLSCAPPHVLLAREIRIVSQLSAPIPVPQWS